MTEGGLSVALVGAASELGRDLRDVLIERAFPVAHWQLLDEAEAIVAVDDEDVARAMRPFEEAALAGVDLVFACGGAEQTARLAATEQGPVVIDLGQTLALRDDVALVVPEVNADLVEDALGAGDRLLATPLPAATALAVALAPIEQVARLRRLTATCLEPVSSSAGGVEELARQTADLLSGREAEPLLWSARIAFNLIPQVGELSGTGATDREWQVQRQLRRVLDLPDLPVALHVVRVPTFYGHGIVVDVETEEPIDTEAGLELFRRAPGMLLHEGEREAANYPTLSDAVGSEATHVGRVREDPTVPCGLSFWLAVDGLRKGTTVNAAQIGECVARELRRRR